MNKCHFSGNLTRDPELKYTPNGTAVLNVTIAVSRRFKKNDEVQTETAFIDSVAWDSGAEAIANHFNKGDNIIVHGSMQQEEWTDKESGQKRTKLKLRIEEFEFPQGNKKKEGGSPPADAPADKPAKGANKPAKKTPAAPPPEDNDNAGDDEVPF